MRKTKMFYLQLSSDETTSKDARCLTVAFYIQLSLSLPLFVFFFFFILKKGSGLQGSHGFEFCIFFTITKQRYIWLGPGFL